jgi:hypothetical protein
MKRTYHTPLATAVRWWPAGALPPIVRWWPAGARRPTSSPPSPHRASQNPYIDYHRTGTRWTTSYTSGVSWTTRASTSPLLTTEKHESDGGNYSDANNYKGTGDSYTNTRGEEKASDYEKKEEDLSEHATGDGDQDNYKNDTDTASQEEELPNDGNDYSEYDSLCGAQFLEGALVEAHSVSTKGLNGLHDDQDNYKNDTDSASQEEELPNDENDYSEYDSLCGAQFLEGALVEAHSLSTKMLNGLRGTVTGRQGDRIQVNFPAPYGGKALKPDNLKIAEAPSWMVEHLRQQSQSRSLGKIIIELLDMHAENDEQAGELVILLMKAASSLGLSLDAGEHLAHG